MVEKKNQQSGVRGKAATHGTTAEENKRIAMEYFQLLGTPMAALRLFTPNARHHNPLTKPGIRALLESAGQVAASGTATWGFDPSTGKFDVENVIAEGDLVLVHTSFGPNVPGKLGGLRQAHIFRIEGGKIAEYWDITQTIPKESPNVAGLP
jgi:predicted SnoaL-like aldol condensation-catalyzing enzyme